MQLNLTDVRLCVEDVQACFVFYRDVVGLKPKFDATGSVYAEFETGGSALGLYQLDLMRQAIDKSHDGSIGAGGERVVLTFQVDSVDDAFTELQGRGVRFIKGPTDQPKWMLRVAHFRDPAGNLLEIHQSLTGVKV